ncbi:hypothetical protein [Methylobacterium sp. Leaf91]|uniref:hypothetical protein n=1 Tax=Methylobacterium sp. Leaf91 TaxID=1736247 RepID=UPI0006FEE6F6|nr:hypothetical protein [Methylobacterium sp. Leaf91]KQO93333.1 hypothetical protein ASF32_03660 [Methylobacterium sp. Leaf91]
MSNRTAYEVRIAARIPSEMPSLISAAASRVFISPSAYVRQALAEKLKRDGFGLPSQEAASAQQAA